MANDKGKEPTPAQEKRTAQQRVEDAQEQLREAQLALAESQGELTAVVMREQPQMIVEVMPGVHISHEDKNYYGEGYPEIHGDSDGTELTLDGPTAMQLALLSQVRIVRSA